MKRFLISSLLLLASVSFSLAQNSLMTTPSAQTISPVSSTITSSAAFQQIFAASTSATGRIDCIIQNKAASNTMFIHFGPPTTGVTLNSLNLAAGATFRCANSGVVIKNEISLGGIAGDRYFAGQ